MRMAPRLISDTVQAYCAHLLSPQVWLIGSYFFCALLCSYAFSFSAPAILQNATGWTIAQVGYLVAVFGLAGAIGMLVNAEHSDRSGERTFHCIIPCLLMGAAFLVAGSWHQAWIVISALGVAFVAFVSMLGPGVSVPTQFLAGRAAAAGIAAMNTITMFSGAVGPVWMGWVKDHTGSYDLGLRALIIPSFAAAGLMYTLTRNLERKRTQHAALAKEPA